MTKLNLMITPDDKSNRSGYHNISAIGRPDQKMACGSVGNLDWIVDDAECDEIIALDVLDFFPPGDVDDVVRHWLSKLRHGGTITIGGIDLYEVAKALVHGRIEVAEANFLIHGNQEVPAECRKANATIQQMIFVLSGIGYEIVHKKIDGYRYYLTAKRP